MWRSLQTYGNRKGNRLWISLTLGPLHRKPKPFGQTSGAVIAPAISQGPAFVIESLNYEDDRRSRP